MVIVYIYFYIFIIVCCTCCILYLKQHEYSALTHAAESGHLAMVKHLIQKYNCDWQRKNTVLMCFNIQ